MIEIENDKERLFKAWATVETVDKQGEIIPVDTIKKLMPLLMDRGGPILDSHTNRPVGKILSYEFKEKDGKPGVMITGKIFDHYQLDDEIWKGMKEGRIKGLSIGGKKRVGAMVERKDIEGKSGRELDIDELYEISITSQPANPEANIVSLSTAKSMEVEKKKAKDVEVEVVEERKNMEGKDEKIEEKPKENVAEKPKEDEKKEKVEPTNMEKLVDSISALNQKMDKLIQALIEYKDIEEEEGEEDKKDKEPEKEVKESVKKEDITREEVLKMIAEQVKKEEGYKVVQTPRPTADVRKGKVDLGMMIARGEVNPSINDLITMARVEYTQQVRGGDF